MSDQQQPSTDDTDTVSTGRLTLTWALVVVPLAYGVFATLRGTVSLFTG
ncbi:MAG: hypothetical protein H0V13_08405 [Nocardioidaceae bacterium]|jgi:hypothetical protein|nr:hypothetical protein [Nocardioidaceae bacterium]